MLTHIKPIATLKTKPLFNVYVARFARKTGTLFGSFPTNWGTVLLVNAFELQSLPYPLCQLLDLGLILGGFIALFFSNRVVPTFSLPLIFLATLFFGHL